MTVEGSTMTLTRKGYADLWQYLNTLAFMLENHYQHKDAKRAAEARDLQELIEGLVRDADA